MLISYPYSGQSAVSVLLELTYCLIHIIFLSILESYDESFRELLGKRLAQTVNLIIIGRGSHRIFHHIAFLITVVTGFALEMGIALAEHTVADKYLKLEDRRISYMGFLLCRFVLSYSSVLLVLSVLLRLSALLSRFILLVLSSVLLNRSSLRMQDGKLQTTNIL